MAKEDGFRYEAALFVCCSQLATSTRGWEHFLKNALKNSRINKFNCEWNTNEFRTQSGSQLKKFQSLRLKRIIFVSSR